MSLSLHSDAAVESITFRSRSSTSRCVSQGFDSVTASGFVSGSSEYTASTFFASRITSASISAALQSRCRICREERIAGSCSENDDFTMIQMADRLSSYIRFCHLTHFDSGLHSCRKAFCLKCILQCHSIHHRCQHSHVVCCCTDPCSCWFFLSRSFRHRLQRRPALPFLRFPLPAERPSSASLH